MVLPLTGSYLAIRFERKKSCGKCDVKSTCFEENITVTILREGDSPRWSLLHLVWSGLTPFTCSRKEVPPSRWCPLCWPDRCCLSKLLILYQQPLSSHSLILVSIYVYVFPLLHDHRIQIRINDLFFFFFGIPHMLQSYDKPRQCIKKQRHYFADKGPYSQSYIFSSSHVRTWRLDHKEGWVLKNQYFQT